MVQLTCLPCPLALSFHLSLFPQRAQVPHRDGRSAPATSLGRKESHCGSHTGLDCSRSSEGPKKAIFVFEEVPSHRTALEPSKGASRGAPGPTGEEVLGAHPNTCPGLNEEWRLHPCQRLGSQPEANVRLNLSTF